MILSLLTSHADCGLDSFSWFAKELKELRRTSFVNLIIHVTRDDIISENASSFETLQANELENGLSSVSGDVEKGHDEDSKDACHIPDFRKGRPDIEQLVTDCLSRCSVEDRVGVGACGPSDLLESTRKAVSRKEYDNGPSIIFHSEVNSFFAQLRFLSMPINYILGLQLVKSKLRSSEEAYSSTDSGDQHEVYGSKRIV